MEHSEHSQAETNREFRKALSTIQKNLEDGRELRIQMFKIHKIILFAESPALESDGLGAQHHHAYHVKVPPVMHKASESRTEK
jgi:hypothetical protein